MVGASLSLDSGRNANLTMSIANPNQHTPRNRALSVSLTVLFLLAGGGCGRKESAMMGGRPLTSTSALEDQAMGKMVMVRFGTNGQESKAVVEPRGRIVDIVWDHQANAIWTLTYEGNDWFVTRMPLDGRAQEQFPLRGGLLPGSRIFSYRGKVCILAGRSNDAYPTLLPFGRGAQEEKTPTTSRDFDSVLAPQVARRRREICAQLKVPLPVSDVATIDSNLGRSGSLASIEARCGAFPVLTGHPSKPLIVFSSDDQMFALVASKTSIYQLVGQNWKRLQASGVTPRGEVAVSAFFASNQLLIGCVKASSDGTMSYETFQVSLSPDKIYGVKNLSGLVATPISERAWNSSERSNFHPTIQTGTPCCSGVPIQLSIG